FQLTELAHQRLITGVITGKTPLQFFSLEGQLRDGRLDLNHLVQDGLGLDGDIDRSGTGLVGIESIFSFFQLLAYLGQLVGEELETLLGFSGFALHVLANIEAAHLVQYAHGERWIDVLESHTQYA